MSQISLVAMRQNETKQPVCFSWKTGKTAEISGLFCDTENRRVTGYQSRKVGWVWHAVRAAVCPLKAAKIVAFPFPCWAGKTLQISVGQAYSVEWCKAAMAQRTESEQREFAVKCKLDWNKFELGTKMSAPHNLQLYDRLKHPITDRIRPFVV